MDGDFKGDFTRDTFDKINRFSRVLIQQGRVSLDADWNEQIDILLLYLRTLTVDLIGPFAGRGDGFLVQAYQPAQSASSARQRTAKDKTGSSSPDFTVAAGHYYVDGIPVENDEAFSYTFDDSQRQRDATFLVYLDVWERQVTYIEDKYIREVALGALGPDTATRAKVVWQVRVTGGMLDDDHRQVPIPYPLPKPPQSMKDPNTEWQQKWVPLWQLPNPYRGQLRAKSKDNSGEPDTTPCIISPESRYRRAENQLYRVEIHKGGTVGTATFKWSRENGSAVFSISNPAGNVLTLDSLGRDKRFGLKKDDWVEVISEDSFLLDTPNPLLQVDTVDYVSLRVTLKGMLPSNIGLDADKHPLLRRWDQNAGEQSNGDSVKLSEGAIVIEEGKWITLEDGVQIWFEGADPKATPPPAYPITYRLGDYWLIPARVATGDVEWPRGSKGPLALGPHGVAHHYAPLAFVTFKGNEVDQICDLRRKLIQLWTDPVPCPPQKK